VEAFGIGERRACGLLGVWRSSCRYRRKPDRNEKLRGQFVALAHERPRFGYPTRSTAFSRGPANQSQAIVSGVSGRRVERETEAA